MPWQQKTKKTPLLGREKRRGAAYDTYAAPGSNSPRCWGGNELKRGRRVGFTPPRSLLGVLKRWERGGVWIGHRPCRRTSPHGCWGMDGNERSGVWAPHRLVKHSSHFRGGVKMNQNEVTCGIHAASVAGTLPGRAHHPSRVLVASHSPCSTSGRLPTILLLTLSDRRR